ncbi:MAG TPA: 1,4-alpha-glucan branching protein [Streptosporangiaceae bacterium]|nr:1,4-alpha-glucan branching protein [Streptosporangiaceae bacterium]
MAVIHATTMSPSKLELLAGWLPRQSWYEEPADAELARAGGFRLDDPEGEVGIEFMVVRAALAAYLVPMTYRGAPLDGAEHALIGTSEHGILGTRWIYDGTQDPVLVAQFSALLAGTAEPQAQGQSDTADPTVHSVPARQPGATVGLRRALVATDEDTARELIKDGGLSATWVLSSGERVRGVFASPA